MLGVKQKVFRSWNRLEELLSSGAVGSGLASEDEG